MTADGGFVLIDALLAAGLLALGGTVVLTIVADGFEREQDELDRSVALVSMQSLSAQFAVLDDAGRTHLEMVDELYRYAITLAGPATSTRLAQWRIEATPLRPGKAHDLSFLARR